MTSAVCKWTEETPCRGPVPVWPQPSRSHGSVGVFVEGRCVAWRQWSGHSSLLSSAQL